MNNSLNLVDETSKLENWEILNQTTTRKLGNLAHTTQ